jgi:hypothetical protein
MVFPPVIVVELRSVHGHRIRIRKRLCGTHDIDRLARRRIRTHGARTTMKRCGTRDESGQISLLFLRPKPLPITSCQLRGCLQRSCRDGSTPQDNPEAQRSQHHHAPMTEHHFLRASTPDKEASVRRVATISLSSWYLRYPGARTPSLHRPGDSRADSFRRTQPLCTACRRASTSPVVHCIRRRQ